MGDALKGLNSVLEMLGPGMKDAAKYMDSFTPVASRRMSLEFKYALPRTFWDRVLRRTRFGYQSIPVHLTLTKVNTIMIGPEDPTLALTIYNRLDAR